MCLLDLVIALGFATSDAEIALNRHDLFGSHLASRADQAVSPLVPKCAVQHHKDS